MPIFFYTAIIQYFENIYSNSNQKKKFEKKMFSKNLRNFLSNEKKFEKYGQRNIFCQNTENDRNFDVFQNKDQSTSFSKNQDFKNSSFFKETKTTGKNFFSSLKNSTPANFQKTSTFQNSSKQQVVSITYEEIGLFPRSFNRVFDRFFKQLFFDVENLVIQEYRFYRYLFLTTVKCLFVLIFVPLGINFFAKNYLIRPVTEYYWNTHNHEIFLNSYQQKRAFTELKNFEEKIYFESLLLSENQIFSTQFDTYSSSKKIEEFPPPKGDKNFSLEKENGKLSNFVQKEKKNQLFQFSSPLREENELKKAKKRNQKEKYANLSVLFNNSLQKRLQTKIFELANHYNEESIEAVTNFFADVLSFTSLCFLLVRLEIQINITKSFLLEVFFGLDDSKKSLLILFITDLLVGYHSPNIWELFFQTIFDHYGLPESQTTIFLLVATLPVLLDVLFKYLIFRHLNRASPATVATYHAMIE